MTQDEPYGGTPTCPPQDQGAHLRLRDDAEMVVGLVSGLLDALEQAAAVTRADCATAIAALQSSVEALDLADVGAGQVVIELDRGEQDVIRTQLGWYFNSTNCDLDQILKWRPDLGWMLSFLDSIGWCEASVDHVVRTQVPAARMAAFLNSEIAEERIALADGLRILENVRADEPGWRHDRMSVAENIAEQEKYVAEVQANIDCLEGVLTQLRDAGPTAA